MNIYMILLLIFTSCSSEDPPAAKTQVLTSTKHSAAKESDFDEYAFYCCNEETLKPFFTKYLLLVQSMGDDNEQKSLRLLSELRTESQNINTPDGTLLAKELSAVQSDSLSSLRESFSLFSSAVIKVIQNNKASTSNADNTIKSSVAFCPMAPGRWLQDSNTIHNPYFGSEMLTCGVFEQ